MAKYIGVYSCGHEGVVNIIGPHKDREWKRERIFSNMCPECYKEYIQKQREEVNKKASEQSEEMELSKLEGTEKQIAWANTLRLDFINKVSEYSDEISRVLDNTVVSSFNELSSNETSTERK